MKNMKKTAFLLVLFLFGVCRQGMAEEKSPIRLVFGGDVTLASWYESIAGTSDPSWPFRRLKPYFDTADLVMVNCETTITDRGVRQPKQFNFRMKPSLARAFPEAGIAIVTIANNHVFDYGRQGLEDTIRHLDEAGVSHVGAGINLAEARKPVWRTIRGIRFAFLGYGNYSPATSDRAGVAYRFPGHVAADIREAKRAGADRVVVNFHWGTERAVKPGDSDRRLAHLAVDAGADVVVGHHPHVLQPVETYRGKIIAYSLGNLIFGGNRNPGRDSALLEATLSNGSWSYRMVPVRIDARETKYQPYILNR